jgi:hypothetical protein
MASSIIFNGRRIVVPQVPVRVDASALDAVGPSATGIVALVGTAEGGEPLTVDLSNDLGNPQNAQDQYRSGDLRTGALFAFNPSNDEAVQGGAARIVPVKVNPATRSAVNLPDAAAVDAITVTSKDWGLFTSQINVDVEAGTTQGKRLVIAFEDQTETLDDVGGDDVVRFTYDEGLSILEWDSITGEFKHPGFTLRATLELTGLASEMTATAPAGLPAVVRVSSTSAADLFPVTVIGVDGSGDIVTEDITLTGTTPASGSTTFTRVVGVFLPGGNLGAGDITVDDGANDIATVTSGDPGAGVAIYPTAPGSAQLPAVGTVDVAVDSAVGGAFIAVIGVDGTGSPSEAYAASGSTVAGSVALGGDGRVQVIALGDIPGARTVTITADAFVYDASLYTSVRRVADAVAAQSGFTAVVVAGDASSITQGSMDAVASPVAIPASGDSGGFTADNFRIVEAVNALSALVSAAKVGDFTGQVIANTTNPAFLVGGTEGTTTITQWTAAFDLLRKRDVNIIVPLTQDPAVHALLNAHLRYRAGEGQSEANGYVGIGTSGGAGEALANIRTQIQSLNSQYISAVSEEVNRFDPITGLSTWFPPYLLAAVAAGMQAGSAVGEPLTRKLLNVLDTRNDSSWSRESDADVLLDSGLMFTEQADGLGIRWVRSVTTFLQSNNLAFIEMSAVESANAAIRDLRRQLDQKIGDRGLASSVSVIKGLATDVLERLVTDEVIAAFRPETLTVEQVGDTFPLSVEIAPVLPINFIPAVIHLVPLQASA